MPKFSPFFLMLSVIFMDLLAGMELDIFVPSFPEIQKVFTLSTFQVEALLSVNFIGYCFSLFLIGNLADRHSRKRIILLGTALFILGSTLCLWKDQYSLLLVGRLLQGVGVAAPSILSFLLIADLYALQSQQKLFALLNGVMNISVGIAPLIGSYLALHYQWKGSFILLLSLSLCVFICTYFFVPFYQSSSVKKEKGFLAEYIELLKEKPLRLLIIHIVILAMPFWVFVGISPLLYIKSLGVPLAHFGYYQGAMAGLFGLGTLIHGKFVDKIDPIRSLWASICFFMFGAFAMGIVTLFFPANPLLITGSFLVVIVAQIIPVNLLYPLCITFFPHAKAKSAALLQGIRLIFTSIFLQGIGYFYTGTFTLLGYFMTLFTILAALTLILVLRNTTLSQRLSTASKK